MAAAASSKPGMVHYFCAFFAVCSLILGVALYLSNSAYNEREAAWQAETKKASESTSTATRALEWVSSLKKKIGHEFDTVGADGEQNANTVLGAMNANIALAGDLAQPTFAATLLKLVEENSALKNRVAAADVDIAAHDRRDKTCADFFITDKINICRFDHRVRRFDRADETFGFDHSECFKRHICSSLFKLFDILIQDEIKG